MKASIKYLVMAVVFMFSLASHSESVRDGGMSGGGGGTAPGAPINSRDVIYSLYSTRLELYMYFNRLSVDDNVNDPLMGPLKEKMLPIIAQTAIHASAEGCKDKFGNEKDGSIYSKHTNAICISVPNMSSKLRKDNLKPQLLGLVAHEYSHLAGLDENEASAVQDWVIQSFSYGAGDVFQSLDEMDASFDLIRSIGDRSMGIKTWNELCFTVDQIDREFTTISTRIQSGIYSAYNLSGSKRFRSFQLKNFLLKAMACGSSDYHPRRDYLLRNYNAAFSGHDQRTDAELAKAIWNANDMVSGNLIIQRVNVVADGLREINDLASFATEDSQYVKTIRSLNREPLY